jgi:hypothetical protein
MDGSLDIRSCTRVFIKNVLFAEITQKIIALRSIVLHNDTVYPSPPGYPGKSKSPGRLMPI